MNRLFYTFAMVILTTATPALAWDPIGDITHPDRIIRNTVRETEKAVKDIPNVPRNVVRETENVGREIDRMRLELQSSIFTGPALEQWIKASRDTAINGAMPMPPNIRQALSGWYSEALMNKVRYKAGDGGALNLANNSIRIGHAEAVTLIDVIVFKGPSEAQDPALWAHEMKHVEQYDSWGVHSFAVQYMRSWNGVEDPAYAIQAEYQNNPGPKFANQVAGPPPQMPGQQFPPQQYQQMGQICATQVGMCGMNMPFPSGSQCMCPTQFGPAYGFVQ
ncbi:protein of unknown function [Bradyrhizobium sp. Rc2d]|uniref:eCIS core domain-containing protein n=1 Tax=Bradyrhizobium sp. Rc2d TaxID=1855321 RepID=UPI00088503F5|nr:DUF4157 domain-containing protein [Bradyrhizobium sp. Rc2d]SDJ88573.1 protein of unknown function [Bradyrhizobium sp. Rc2d]